MTKKEIRQLFKAKRQNISDQEKLKLDDLLLIQFQQFSFEATDCLLSYWPIEHHNEPNVTLATRFLHLMVPHLQIAYPVTNPLNQNMEAMIVDENTHFNTNQLGITEPIDGITINPASINIVFVPLLAYDNLGYRVGYGKGYYDRYLAKCPSNSLKIGFSYFEPIAQITDKDQFDVPLSYCITPQHIYEF